MNIIWENIQRDIVVHRDYYQEGRGKFDDLLEVLYLMLETGPLPYCKDINPHLPKEVCAPIDEPSHQQVSEPFLVAVGDEGVCSANYISP